MTEERVERVARAIHYARWAPEDAHRREPFEDEDRRGREYCFRLANAAIASMSTPEGELEGRARELLAAECGYPVSSATERDLSDLDEVFTDHALRAITKALSIPSTVRGEVLEEAAKAVDALKPSSNKRDLYSHWSDAKHDRELVLERAAAAIRALKGKPTPEGEGKQ